MISIDSVKLEEVLVYCGINKKVAKVLSYLSSVEEASTVEIERNTGLRQPEVSNITKMLERNGYLESRTEKVSGKGRPRKVYKLKVKIDDIINDIIEQLKIQVNELKKRINELNSIYNNK